MSHKWFCEGKLVQGREARCIYWESHSHICFRDFGSLNGLLLFCFWGCCCRFWSRPTSSRLAGISLKSLAGRKSSAIRNARCRRTSWRTSRWRWMHCRVCTSASKARWSQMVRLFLFLVSLSVICDYWWCENVIDAGEYSRSLIVFASILKYRMSSDVYSYLARLDVKLALWSVAFGSLTYKITIKCRCSIEWKRGYSDVFSDTVDIGPTTSKNRQAPTRN